MQIALFGSLLLGFPVANALSLVQRDSPAVVALPIRKSVASHLSKRASTVSGSITNELTSYMINVTLGTPEQAVSLILDTGSSDLWVNEANSTLCSAKGNQCASTGTYDSSSSSSYAFVNSEFNITYADGSGAAGDYVTDTLHLGSSTLDAFEFGVAATSSSAVGVMGVGYTLNEAILEFQGTTTYNNFPLALTKAGLINSNAYSLWLDDLAASTGSILFGGTNTDKFTGSLETVPILPESGYYVAFNIALTGVTLESSTQNVSLTSSSLPAAALLDSGTSLTYLPDDLVTDIYNELGVAYDSSAGVGVCDCSLANQDVSVVFTFSSPAIKVTMSELVLSDTSSGGVMGKRAQASQCVFGIAPAGDSQAILGDTFLRSAYVVYDLANNEISLAQTNFNATGTGTVLEITTGTNAVPDATLVANAVTTVAAGTVAGGAVVATATLSSSSSQTGMAATMPRANQNYLLGAVVAIALAVVL
jgi:hypothetical protein